MYALRLFIMQRFFLTIGKLPSGFRGVLQFAAVSFSLSLAGCASEGPLSIDNILPLKSAEVSSASPFPGPLSDEMRAKARAAMKPTSEEPSATQASGPLSEALQQQQKTKASLKSAGAPSVTPVPGPYAEALRAKAKALAFTDSDDAKAQAQIDRAMLAQSSGPATQRVEPATHRIEGSGLIAATQRADVASQPVERLGLQAAPSELSREEMLRRLHELALKAHAQAPKVEVEASVQPYGSLASAATGVKSK